MQPEQFKQMLEKLEEIRCGLIDVETAVERRPETNEPGGADFQCSDLVRVLRDVTEYAARNCCLHEETHRGGVLWEIYDHCGCKWADDEGGMPPEAREYPPEIKKAFDVLGRYSHDHVGVTRRGCKTKSVNFDVAQALVNYLARDGDSDSLSWGNLSATGIRTKLCELRTSRNRVDTAELCRYLGNNKTTKLSANANKKLNHLRLLVKEASNDG